jgi:gliding motility-associatede transport system auxiliary component
MSTFARIWFWEGLVLVVFAGLSVTFLDFVTVYELLFPLVMGGLGLLGLAIALVSFLARWSKTKEDRAGQAAFGQQAKFGTNAIVYTLVFAGILVFVNIVAAGRTEKVDLTSAKVNTLSDQTVTVVANLPAGSQLEIAGFFKAGESKPFEDLAKRYADLSGQVSFRAIDPDMHPEEVQRYAITERGAVAVTCDTPDAPVGAPVCTGQTNVTMDITEQGLTTAIMKVSAPQSGTIYFLDGHGEAPLDGQEERGYGLIKTGLQNENLNLQTLVLLTAGRVPEDAQLVIVAGPTKKLPPNEVTLLETYLNAGGRMMVLTDPNVETGLEPLLATYGIEPQSDIVVDRQVRLFEGSVLGLDPLVVNYGVHEITKKFGESPTLYHEARSLKLQGPAKLDGVSAEPFLFSSDTSWGETDLSFFGASGTEPELDLTLDLAGPLVLGATATRKIGDSDSAPTAKLVVIGDADFAANRYVPQGFNADLFFNAINWATGQEAYISVRPNTFAPDVFTLTQKDTALIFFGSVFFLPQLVVMLGIGMAIYRRRE